MSKNIIFSLASLFVFAISIYTINYTDIDGNAKSMSQYQNKKIFIVNIATQSPYTSQCSQLEQLYQQHKDSMVVLGVPSNSFGYEPRTNTAIKSYLQNTYGITFPLTQKSIVKGDTACSLYKWLTKQSDNGVMNTRIKGDFQKYLIDRAGALVAVFDSSTAPLDPIIQQAIHDN